MSRSHFGKLLCGGVYAGGWAVLLHICFAALFGQFFQVSLPVWLFGTMLVYLLSAAVTHSGGSVPVWAALDIAATIALPVLIFFLVSPVPTADPYFTRAIFAVRLMAAALTLGGCLSAYVASLKAVTVPQMISQIDVLLLFILFAILVYLSNRSTAGALAAGLVYLLAEMFALQFLRGCGQRESAVSSLSVSGILFSAGVLLALFLAAVGLLCLFPGSAHALVVDLGRRLAWLWSCVWEKITAFFVWLASLFRFGDGEWGQYRKGTKPMLSMELPPANGLEQMAKAAIPVLAVAAVCIMAAMIYFRTRHKKERKKNKGLRRTRAAGLLRRRWEKCLLALRLRLLFLFRRNTPAGTLLWLEHWGKAHKLPRKRGETYRGYFCRLAAHPDLAPRRKALTAQLELFADALDQRYFGQGEEKSCSRTFLRELRRGVGPARGGGEKGGAL